MKKLLALIAVVTSLNAMSEESTVTKLPNGKFKIVDSITLTDEKQIEEIMTAVLRKYLKDDTITYTCNKCTMTFKHTHVREYIEGEENPYEVLHK